MPKVNPVTGVGITTQVGMESADLGIMRWDDQRGCVAAMFGDNFEFWKMGGSWQSPSIVLYDNDFNVLGVPTPNGIDPHGKRKQLWDYPHNNADYSTILPCDFVRVGDWWYVACMVTAGLGHEKRTVFWRSHDLFTWEKTNPYVSLVHTDNHMRPIGHPGDTMLTFDVLGGWVYVFGTGGLSRDKSLYLWRSQVDEFPYGTWEPWGFKDGRWSWGNPNDNTPIMVGRFGELSFRVIQGNCVLSYFDSGEYRQTALCAMHPTDNWTEAKRVDYANGWDFPQLYGGYIAPSSKLNERHGMKFLVSQWNTSNNDPYHVVRFDDTLEAAGPLEDVKPPVVEEVPTPDPKPQPPLEGGTMTPQQLYELLLKELSASGSLKITTPDGRNITLRDAIAQIYEKERCILDMSVGRPRHPREGDDQLGHVLNTRAEGLFTQAVVVALADKAGINTSKIYQQVQESLG